MADWDAYVDDRGYTYYYNRITGDTAWEIPPHAAADVVDQPPATTPESVASSEPTDGTQVGDTWSATSEGGEWAFGGVNPADGTFYFIHTTTGERVTNLPMDTPQSATSNANKHDYVGPILLDKVAPEVQRCMDDLVQTIETQLAVWMRRRQRNAKALAKQHKGHRGRQTNKQAVVQQLPQQHHHPTPVRMTQLLVNAKRYEYSAEYAARRAELDAQLREDEVQKEVVRVTDRLALRRQRQVKQAAAWRRADIKEEQIQLRHHFTRVLVAKATNGLDIHGKIDLSSGDDSNNNHGEPATKLKRDELFESEERAALARHRTRQLERLFVAMDTDKRGTVSALHVLHHLVTHPTDAQRWVQPPRRGLDDLVTTGVLQAFFLQLRRVNLRQFATFVDISEDVVAQVDRIQAAMERAGLGVVSADVATWQSSMSNVKTGEAANRKQLVVNRLQQSFCTAKETCLAQVRHVLHFRELRSSGATTGPTGDDQQPIWQLAHKHVYLQLQPSLPSYCVHCRRCRARLGKLDRYDVEGTHRATWGRHLARRMHNIEMSLRQWPTGTNAADETDLASIAKFLAQSSDSTTTAALDALLTPKTDEVPSASMAHQIVRATLNDTVAAASLLASYDAWEARVLAPSQSRLSSEPMPTTSGTPASRGSSHDLLAKLTKRREEVEREEMARALMFEEDERSHEEVERAKVAMETPLILEQDAAHREFVRLLQKCLDPSIMLKRLNFERVLAVRSPTDNMVLRMVDSATNMHCIVHTIRCASVDEADNVVMLARQLHHHRPPHTVEVLHVFQYMYQQFATHGNLNECWPVVFVVTEDCMEGGYWLPPSPRPPLPPADILHILNAVSGALAALHSQHICHWNLNARNLYRSNVYAIDDAAGERRQQLKLGGFLAFKQPFTQDDLSKLPSIVHPSLVPPELTRTSRCTSGMMLNEKTDMWMLGCLLYSLVTGSEQVVREKSLSTIMTDIPLRYGTSIRSCLRMLLQPLPQHRPTAMEIFNFISCASPDEGVAADTKASSFSMTLKKSVRSLHPLPSRVVSGENISG